MRESVFETLIGLGVLVVAAVFLFFALGQGGDAAVSKDTTQIGARFSSASGVERGTDVRMAGVKIGTVREKILDRDRVEAQVVMVVDKAILPLGDGTTARVQSDGLLGGTYINLEPAPGFGDIPECAAGEELFGESGCNELLYAQGSVDLMTLFASFAQGGGGSNSSSSSSDASSDEFPDYGPVE